MVLLVDGAEIHWEWLGSGATSITLINGYTRPSSDFRMFARRLEKHGIRSLVFDNRGAGQTIVHRPFSLGDMVNDVTALWQHVGIEDSSVLGISMGGMIAQTLALAVPECISKLVLVSTGCRSQWIREGELPWSADEGMVKKKLEPYFSQGFLRANQLLVNSMAKQIARAAGSTDFSERASLQRQAISEFDACQQLAKLKMPTLVVHGDEDRVIAPEAALDLDQALSDSTLRLFKDCGHLILAERSKEFAEAVVDFIQPVQL